MGVEPEEGKGFGGVGDEPCEGRDTGGTIAAKRDDAGRGTGVEHREHGAGLTQDGGTVEDTFGDGARTGSEVYGDSEGFLAAVWGECIQEARTKGVSPCGERLVFDFVNPAGDVAALPLRVD